MFQYRFVCAVSFHSDVPNSIGSCLPVVIGLFDSFKKRTAIFSGGLKRADELMRCRCKFPDIWLIEMPLQGCRKREL